MYVQNVYGFFLLVSNWQEGRTAEDSAYESGSDAMKALFKEARRNLENALSSLRNAASASINDDDDIWYIDTQYRLDYIVNISLK